MRSKKTLLGICVVWLIFICLNSPQVILAQSDVIKIGFEGSLTGPKAEWGQSALQGFEIALEEINKKGGILGKKVVSIVRDDEAKPPKGISNVQEMVHKERMHAMVGPVDSGTALAFINILQEAKIPMVSYCASATKITNKYKNEPKNYIFGNTLMDEYQTRLLIRWASKKYGKIAFLVNSTGYGQLGLRDYLKRMKELNLEPVAIEKFNTGDQDVTSQLTKIRNAGADAIGVYAIAPEASTIVRSMAKVNYSPQVFGSWALLQPNVIDLAGEDLVNGLIMATSYTEDTNERTKALAEKIRAKYGEIIMFVVSGQCYDAVRMLATAMEKAGTTEGEKVRDALEDLTNFHSLYGIIERPYTKDRHQAIRPQKIHLGVWKNGKVVKYEDEVTKALGIR